MLRMLRGLFPANKSPGQSGAPLLLPACKAGYERVDTVEKTRNLGQVSLYLITVYTLKNTEWKSQEWWGTVGIEHGNIVVAGKIVGAVAALGESLIMDMKPTTEQECFLSMARDFHVN